MAVTDQNPNISTGERVPKRVPNLGKHVEERFGILPNFFRLAPETPEITEKLWGFAQAAYLDNPLPSVFMERLFVHLSRFCAVRYCIAFPRGQELQSCLSLCAACSVRGYGTTVKVGLKSA